ncbi:hypothetical protein [Bacteroides sp. 519]|uniref:hypothetical protein n=1 Tax=Bacteroides sp. 519 TaxID=2302937 RepID=UPI0013D4D8BE|nr:hypothetical protein [Bacteroides sp. 519]
MLNFLKIIQQRIYRDRKRLDINTKYVLRKEITQMGNFVEIWFLTKGCQWDASGGCVMCNYGKGHNINENEMISSISQAINEAGSNISELAITPSGSFLDTNEVPISVRHFIYDKIKKSHIDRFIFETRVDTITKSNIKELKEYLPNKKISIEIGLETSSQWISNFCLNKGTDINDYMSKFKLLKECDIEIIANISLGIPFLSENQSIESAVKTIKWAYKYGADNTVIFPLHVKPYTLSAVLYEKGFYNPISLWSLIHVLNLVPIDYLEKTQISWYKNYYTDPSKIIASPYTCPCCFDKIICLLDEYRATCSIEILKKINSFTCSCKTKWLETLNLCEYSSLDLDSLYYTYEELSKHFSITSWWDKNKNAIYSQLKNM